MMGTVCNLQHASGRGLCGPAIVVLGSCGTCFLPGIWFLARDWFTVAGRSILIHSDAWEENLIMLVEADVLKHE